ncbi:hypothetical protein [Deinococcus saxicola]|uniref:hypothetical protein n=1 Tax=Deinococcus saxicola TaxID=249406 RepID=UPI0039EF90D9
MADKLTLTATGLPAGWQAKATVGKTQVSFPTAQTLTLTSGTYTVTPSAVTDGRKVYVAKPVKIDVKGNVAAKISYTKLPPGSPDPFFGRGGVVTVQTPGLDTWDSWTLKSSGAGLPILIGAGTFDRQKQQLVTLNGTLLGPVTAMTRLNRDVGSGYITTPLIKDGDGFLAGLSYTQGTVVRYTAQGQLDPNWRTTPGLINPTLGLLRVPDGGVVAYGGNGAPTIWKLNGQGVADTQFGQGGVLSLAGLDAGMATLGEVVAARVMGGGTMRAVVVQDQRLMLVNITAAGQPTVIAPSIELPMPFQQHSGGFEVRDVVLQADGSALILVTDLTSKRAQLLRITAEGRLDNQFKSSLLADVSRVVGLAVQQDGKIIAAINRAQGQVLRFNTDGSPDRSFGADGTVKLTAPLAAVEVATDGKIKTVEYELATPLAAETAYVRITQLLAE